MKASDSMQILTVYIPKKYVKAIDKISAVRGNWQSEESGNLEDPDFPSRSEFIRVAIREALIKYLDFHAGLEQFNDEPREITLNKLKHFNG
ncbi:unnamed protein product, partial [marine sediment metagenome]